MATKSSPIVSASQFPNEEITVTLVKIIVITVLIILSILFLGRFFI